MEPNWKPLPRALGLDSNTRAAARAKAAVDREVDDRDGRTCQCCGRRGNPYALTTLGKIHRAHIKAASLGGEYSAKNLVSLCWICHALHHTKRLLYIVGTNANKPLRFRIAASVIERVFLRGVIPEHVTVVRGQ
jgi:hypothetical protein